MIEKIPKRSHEEIKKIIEDLSRLSISKIAEEAPINPTDIIKALVFSFYTTLDSMPFQNDKLFLKTAIHSLLYLTELELGKDWNKDLPKYED